MKSELFLLLPVAATLFNLLFALELNHAHSKVDAQPVVNEAYVDRCADNSLGECYLPLDDYRKEDAENFEHDLVDPEQDPMLKLIPGTDFKAYVRADVATFYGQEPGSMKERKPSFKGQAGKFINMSPDRVSLYWDGPSEPVFNANLGPWESGGTACYPSHNFIITKPHHPEDVICRFDIVKGTSVYYCDPFSEESRTQDTHARGAVAPGKLRSLHELSNDDLDDYAAHVYNLEFGELYKNFTGGSEWLSMYPRDPPKHHIWRADFFGQQHVVQTQETQFIELPPSEELHSLSISEMRRDAAAPLPLAEYREPGILNLTLTALSVAPRAFEIRHFLSDAEADHILELVNKQKLVRSTTNGHESSTRTSTTTWLERHSDPVIDAVYRRAADVLRLDEALLRHREPDEIPDMPTSAPINEALQIVHYNEGQEYTAHHDFGYPKGTPNSPSRSINLCMYLNDVEEGGKTSFPRWRNGETSASLDVKPEKLKAMIFYMVNPDGNLDDLSQHAALPVGPGSEKWFSNLWIWDDVRL
jgi:prolyl 4-hydroxylase